LQIGLYLRNISNENLGVFLLQVHARVHSFECGLESLDHVLRYSQNVELGLFFVFKRVGDVKSTYVYYFNFTKSLNVFSNCYLHSKREKKKKEK